MSDNHLNKNEQHKQASSPPLFAWDAAGDVG